MIRIKANTKIAENTVNTISPLFLAMVSRFPSPVNQLPAVSARLNQLSRTLAIGRAKKIAIIIEANIVTNERIPRKKPVRMPIMQNMNIKVTVIISISIFRLYHNCV